MGIAFLDEMQAQAARKQPLPAASQKGNNGEPQTSKIEALRSQRGKLIITDSRSILKLPDVGPSLEIKVIAIWEFGKEAQKVRGVEFVLYGRQSGVVRVDLDDLAEMSRACNLLSELAETLKDREAPTANYVHRSGLSIGFARVGGGPLKAVLFVEGALVHIPVDSLPAIGNALDSVGRVLSAQ